MKHTTHDEWNTLPKRRFTIPFELVYEAQQYAVSIEDTCINALKQEIQERKAMLYVASFLKNEHLSTNGILSKQKM